MRALKLVVPVLILTAGALGAWAIIAANPKVEPAQITHQPPLVSVLTATPQSVKLRVHSQGVVAPRIEIDLVPEVSGKVTNVHPAFAAGGFFKSGEVLVQIDPRDYDFAVTKTAAQVAEARKELLREEAEAEQASREWKALGGGRPSDFVLRKPHLAERRAKLAAAQADLAEAKLTRTRCELRAPFDGRVRTKQVDIGQYVSAGAALARIYATDVAEVRLPIVTDQLDFVDLPLSYRDGKDKTLLPEVTLRAQLGGRTHHWRGAIVRTEGAFDDKTGTLYAVAQVRDPYGYREDAPPLAVGLFVHAEIEGRERSDLISLPHTALVRGAHQVLVVDRESQVHIRPIRVLRRDRDKVFVSSGVEVGEHVIISALDTPVDGMKVRVGQHVNRTADHAKKPSEASAVR